MTVSAANGSSDYEDHLLPSQKVHTGVLKMRGLPFAATPEDIVYWFNSSGLPIARLNADRSAAIHLFFRASSQICCVAASSMPTYQICWRVTVNVERFLSMLKVSVDAGRLLLMSEGYY